jgi:2-dehydro-3-deoxyphosphogluconate aldolase/(4S)-4-hydroxy-2-oxoglutarate aldolase
MTPAFDLTLQKKLEDSPVVAVLVLDRIEYAVPLAKALHAGGVTAIELTLRTPVALDAIRLLRDKAPEMMIGTGTVLTPEQVREAAAAGASFAVSPGMNTRVVNEARDAGLSFAPGVATPTDVELALECGCRLLKFFPAEPMGGLKYLRAIAAPYLHLGIGFIPLGGVNADNMVNYLSDPLVRAIGGSWLAPRDAMAQGDWNEITRRATEAVRRARDAAGPP